MRSIELVQRMGDLCRCLHMGVFRYQAATRIHARNL